MMDAANPRSQKSVDFRRLCQNIPMARGWESKDVESAGPSKESPKMSSGRDPKTESNRSEQGILQLQLSRTRIANDLSTALIPITANPSKPPSPTSTKKSPTSPSRSRSYSSPCLFACV